MDHAIARDALLADRWHHRAVDQLQTMRVFVRVAQRAGFAAAARDLSMSPAAVTKHVAALESRIRARLFDRTTRSVSLTEAGQAYLERCLECLQAFEDADDSVNRARDKPAGRLRVTAPVDFGPGIMASLARYMKQYEDVTVDLQLSNRAVDLVDEGFDVALRIAPSLTGQYVARPLAITKIAVLAAPDYLRRYGRPRTPEDLAKHRTMVFTEPRPRDEWVMERAGKRVTVKLKSAMLSNSGRALQEAGRAGVGILMIPSLGGVEDVAAGMEPLLLDWTVLPALRLFALYPHRRFLSAKVRLFVETLREDLGDPERDPWWDAIAAGANRKPKARR
jgi:DNA-binding transcriptional LysR family regulator